MKSSFIGTITIVGLMFVGWMISPPNALAKVIHVPQDFPTLQGAVNDAMDGDKIVVAGSFVGAGARIVEKRLDLNGGGALINAKNPVSGNTAIVVIGSDASGTSISHFNIQADLRDGIFVSGANEVTISHNTFLAGGDIAVQAAIFLVFSSDSLVSYNNVEAYGQFGIFAFFGNNNLIKHNTVKGGSGFGFAAITLVGANDNMVSQNRVSQDTGCEFGIAQQFSFRSRITFNDLRGICIDFFEFSGDNDPGPNSTTFVQRNFSDGPILEADNRGEGAVNLPDTINPSLVLPHGEEIPLF